MFGLDYWKVHEIRAVDGQGLVVEYRHPHSGRARLFTHT